MESRPKLLVSFIHATIHGTVVELIHTLLGKAISLSLLLFFFFFSSRRRHTRLQGDWSSDVCSSDLLKGDQEFLAGDPTDSPCYGSALTYLLPQKRSVPPHVALPHIMRNVVKLAGQIGRASCRERV